MAEILKITTPLVNKNHIQPNKQVTDPTVPFNLQETSKVIAPSPQSDLLSQNNGMIKQDESPSILMNLMKDPTVTVGFLKNIFMLQEIIKLLPINNEAMTQEIGQLFDSLLLKPETIVAEMMLQQNTSTAFKGELFDYLRQLVSQGSQPEMNTAIANLLKSINSQIGKQDILGAIGNSLDFLGESLSPSQSLSQKLFDLSSQFYTDDAPERFNQLKFQVFDIFKEIENSILLSPKMTKVMAISIYNLSRFNDNPDFFQDSVSNLLTLIDGRENKAEFVTKIKNFLSLLRDPEQTRENSKVMDVLAKILGKQANDETIALLNPEKIEKIIHSLLSSPCNFTPLLHFVVPMEFMDMRSFAEFWIDPNGEGDPKDGPSKRKDTIHMLITFDIEGIGQFEAELFVVEEKITLSLLCPPAYVGAFSGLPANLAKSVRGSRYSFNDITIGKLKRPRSLMDVFKALPYKRAGVDVKV